jgi:hypothetical protein
MDSSSSKLNAIKKLISLDKAENVIVPLFENAAKDISKVLSSDKPEGEKYLNLFDICLKLGILDPL